MIDLNKLKESVNSLLDLSGEEQITKTGEIMKALEDVSAERDALLTEKNELTRKYRESVMNAHLPPQHTAEENGSQKSGISWEQLISDFNAKKGQ